MKKLVLHVGAHKTATTFIQSALLRNVERLAAMGVSYDGIGAEAASAVNLLARDASSETVTDAAEKCLDRLDLGMPTCLLSWEGLLGPAFHRGKLYGLAQRYMSLFEKLRDMSGRDLHLVFYTRRQDQFLSSYYIQTVKEGSDLSSEAFLQSVDTMSMTWTSRVP